ncbi:TFIIH complex serine/threonine-protein kinase subunit kin28 [Ascosphaera pollenicola]|nr:TFIIH complex serine/threonine-protein kinase subunit kin28 [Ascosphaera pollenicola]
MSLDLSSVNAILISSTQDSSRIFAKYYTPPHLPASNAHGGASAANPYPTSKEQHAFEKGLVEKTSKSTSEVILYDNRVVVYKAEGDVMLYVVGAADENEILLHQVITSLRDSLNQLLRAIDKRTILENYDLVSLCIDEIVDDGIILETDALLISSRVSKAPAQDPVSMKSIDLSEQGLLNVWEFGKRRLAEQLRQGL